MASQPTETAAQDVRNAMTLLVAQIDLQDMQQNGPACYIFSKPDMRTVLDRLASAVRKLEAPPTHPSTSDIVRGNLL